MNAADITMDKLQQSFERRGEIEWSYRYEDGEYFINVINTETLEDEEAYIIEWDGTLIER